MTRRDPAVNRILRRFAATGLQPTPAMVVETIATLAELDAWRAELSRSGRITEPGVYEALRDRADYLRAKEGRRV